MTDGRGKLGGQVASKNRSGAYVRTKVTPANPQTSYQSEVRQSLAIASKTWDILSEKLRESWNNAANSGEWNRTNVFGDATRPTGKNLFTSININSVRVSGVGIMDVPQKAFFANTTTSSLDAVFVAPGQAPDLILEVDAGGDFMPGTRFEVQATPPVSAGRSYFKNDFRFISSSNLVAEDDNTLDLGSEWYAKFGDISSDSVGRKIAVRYRQVLFGQVSPWQSAVAIIAPATP